MEYRWLERQIPQLTRKNYWLLKLNWYEYIEADNKQDTYGGREEEGEGGEKLGLEDRKDARGGEERTEVFLFKDWHKPVCIK